MSYYITSQAVNWQGRKGADMPRLGPFEDIEEAQRELPRYDYTNIYQPGTTVITKVLSTQEVERQGWHAGWTNDTKPILIEEG